MENRGEIARRVGRAIILEKGTVVTVRLYGQPVTAVIAETFFGENHIILSVRGEKVWVKPNKVKKEVK